MKIRYLIWVALTFIGCMVLILSYTVPAFPEYDLSRWASVHDYEDEAATYEQGLALLPFVRIVTVVSIVLISLIVFFTSPIINRSQVCGGLG